ncbi:MAG: peptidase M23 [Ignavibacteriae bacterium]|nr:MAG: peptidase M23 [Ignavibacteriota bacterium]
MKYPKQLLLTVIFISSIFIKCTDKKKIDNEIKEAVKIKTDRYGFVIDSLFVLKKQVKKNETLTDILASSGLTFLEITEIYNKAKPLFDFRKIRPKNKYVIYQNLDSLNSFAGFVYEINKIQYVTVIKQDSFIIKKHKREVTLVEKEISGEIVASLYKTLLDQNASIILAGELAQIFAWQIDFYTIQRGDKFFAVYNEQLVDGKPIGIENISYAKFIHKGNSYYAFLYNQNDEYDYFDADGASLQKQFLKAPLKYRRISSKYSNRRLHPILRVYRPHRGIDYAAAIGTPVQAVGDGIITFVGRKGGAGRMVKIRHNSVYRSAYLHLSGYGKGVRRNMKVKQGQVIGFVGSSGLSTGPHLDFRFWKNGSLVNYMTQKFPSSESVADTNLKTYKIYSDSLKRKLDEMQIVLPKITEEREQERNP